MNGLPWFWWMFGICAAGTMWWLTFHDLNHARRSLAFGLALVYTAGLVLALWIGVS